MSFIRPEVRTALWRWRELLSSVGVAGLGLYLVPLIIAGLALGLIGVQRARFRGATGGPGVVQVDEGQIAYFGPLTGGVAAISDLTLLSLDPTMKPAHWVLEQPTQAPLYIPVTAEGVDALFDVFATLPGLKTQTLLSALNAATDHRLVIWQRTSAPLTNRQLQ